MRSTLILFTFAIAALSTAGDPTTSHTITAFKMASAPVIDGTINDDEWRDVPQMTGMVDAQDGSPAPEASIFWLAYDDKYIYFAARLKDSKPETIKMTEYRSNSSLSGDDTVQLDIDPYGALSDWSHFAINPRGATKIEIAGGRAAKREWMGDFVAKARVTADGWEAEARIPWQLMKLPGHGAREVRFDFDRYMSRTDRNYDFTNTVGGDLRGVGRWQNVELPKIQEDVILNVLPYSYQGIDKQGGVFNSGADLKFPLTDQMTLVGTVNPDFRNIENQILSIDFSRFERLANESRPFFQEGAQYYGSALIATQRIKAFDSGLNLYGKINSKLAMGLLNTADFGNVNSFATTLQYQAAPNTQLRFSHSNLDTPDLKNRGYLYVMSQQIGKPLNLFLRGMSTEDAARGKGEQRDLNLNYNMGELNVNGGYRQISPNFLPRLGFSPERDLKGVSGSIGWNHQVKTGLVSEFFLGSYAVKYDHFAGGNYRRGTGGDLNVTLRSGLQINGNADFNQFEGVNDHTYTLGLAKPKNDPYRNWNLAYTWGEIEGDAWRSIAVGSSYRPSNQFQLNLVSQFVHHVTDQQQIILGGSYDLGHDRAISGRLVKSDTDINAYLSLQRSGGAGIEYFLILGDPNAQKFRSSLILKATYPLQMFMGKRSH